MSFETIRESTRTARRKHRCTWCGEPIEPGQSYCDVVGKFDGDFQPSKYHPECDKAVRRSAVEEPWCMANDGFMPFSEHRGKSWHDAPEEVIG